MQCQLTNYKATVLERTARPGELLSNLSNMHETLH